MTDLDVILSGDTLPAFLVGDHVEGGDTRETYDHGRVVEVVGDDVTVAWRRAECTTTQDASVLRPYDSATDERLAVEE